MSAIKTLQQNRLGKVENRWRTSQHAAKPHQLASCINGILKEQLLAEKCEHIVEIRVVR